jgi:hypothetical protein
MSTSPPNPYDPPQSPQPPIGDWKTWSPFVSKTARDISANMTPEEKSAAMRRAGLYGVWCAVSVALPIQFIFLGLATGNLKPVLATTGGLLVVAHFVCIPIWLRRQRQFLCNTIWARNKGIRPGNLKLFRFG